jgi:hypothetical protein
MIDPGLRTPLVDSFRRGEVARDVRLEAAQGAMAPRALEQLAVLLILTEDADGEIRQAAGATLQRIPRASFEGLLARTDLPGEMRRWLEEQGITPAATPPASDEPLVDTGGPMTEETPEEPAAAVQTLATMSVMQRMKVAMRGTREQRSLLIRDPNRLVASAVLSSPKLTEHEVEQFARMANVTEEVLRVIGSNRAWVKNYSVAANLVRNPKAPIAMTLQLLNRLTEKDVKMLTSDRNIPEPLRIAARKKVSEKASTR